MNNRNEKSIKFRIGIIFHGNKIWLSELFSYVLALILLTALLVLSIRIFKNELLLSKSAELIQSLKTETIHLENELVALREKRNIYETLTKFTYNKVSPQIVSILTNELYQNGHQFGYDPLLLLAVIRVESYFDPKALGRYRSGSLSGAFGLMQLKTATAQEVASMLNMGTLSEEDLFKPDINIILGTAYLTKLISHFKSFKVGLIAYNIGPGTVMTSMKKNEALPLNYYGKVITAYLKLKKIAEKSISNNN